MGNENNPTTPTATPEGAGEQRGTTPTTPAPAAPTAPVTPTRSAAEIERERCSEIYAICSRFQVEPDEYIKNGTSIDQVRAAILDKLERESKPLSSHVQVVADEEDRYRDAARDGLLMRMGEIVEKPAEGAEDFRGMSLHQLMADCAMRSGVKDAHRKSPDELWMELGLFKIKETCVTHSDEHTTLNRTPKVTGKGQVYLLNKILGRKVEQTELEEKAE